MVRTILVVILVLVLLVSSGCISGRDDAGAGGGNETGSQGSIEDNTPLSDDFVGSGSTPTSEPPQMPDLPS